MTWFWDLVQLSTGVNNTPKAVSQLSVSQKSTIPQPSCLASRSEQLQEKDFSLEVAEG